MSTTRGSTSRKRPQKYQNRTAFKNDLHDTSQKTKIINSLEVSGVCKRCKDIIEWKIKYKKYKPLSAPRKCVGCEQKSIKYAYHMLCGKCASEKQVCAKCCKSNDDQSNEEQQEERMTHDVEALLKGMPERKRRTILRYISKQENSQQKINMANLESMISEMGKATLEEDFPSDESSEENSDNEEK